MGAYGWTIAKRFLRRDQGRIDVILKDDVAKLGYKGQVVPVRRGYARNHLVPRNMAVYATNDNRSMFGLPIPPAHKPPPTSMGAPSSSTTTTESAATTASSSSSSSAKLAQRRWNDESRHRLATLTLTFHRPAAKDNAERVTGRPITAKTIFSALTRRHLFYTLDLRQILLAAPLDTIGEHKVRVMWPDASTASPLPIDVAAADANAAAASASYPELTVKVLAYEVGDGQKRLLKAAKQKELAEAAASSSSSSSAAAAAKKQ